METSRIRSGTRRAGSATAAPRCRSTSRWTSCRAGPAPRASASRDCPIVHVTPGLDGVSRAVNEAERGLLPAEATIVCGQPVALDASRAPDGKWIIWIQLQELPAGRVKGDAAGEIDTGDGIWTEALREAYADRIVRASASRSRTSASATLRRVVLSPADIEAMNVNLVGGDIYGGSCSLDQNLLWRPLAAAPGHAHGGRRPLAHRREHASRARARRRLRLPRRQGADEAAAATPSACKASRTLVKLGLSEISTVNASFAEDVAAYAAAGFDAIGIWEFKLPARRRGERGSVGRARATGRELRAPRALGAAARDSRDGRPGRPERAHRGALHIGPAPRRLPAGVRRLPGRAARAAHRGRRPLHRRSKACSASTRLPARQACASASSRSTALSTARPAWSIPWQPPTRSSPKRALGEVGIMVDTYNLWDDPDVLALARARTSAGRRHPRR